MECYINFHDHYLLDHLEGLERQIGSVPLSFATRDQIHKELDKLLDIALSQDTTCSASLLEEVKDRLVALYGKTDDLCLEQETQAIFCEALAIQNLFEGGSLKKLRIQLKGLQKALSLLWKNFCPGLEERKRLAIAKQILQNGKRLLKGEEVMAFYENPFQQTEREEAFAECVNYITNF